MGISDALKFLAPTPSLPPSPSPKHTHAHAHTHSHTHTHPHSHSEGNSGPAPRRTHAGRRVLLTAPSPSVTPTPLGVPSASTSTTTPRDRAQAQPPTQRNDDDNSQAQPKSSKGKGRAERGSKGSTERAEERLRKLDERVGEVYPHLAHSRSNSSSSTTSSGPRKAASSNPTSVYLSTDASLPKPSPPAPSNPSPPSLPSSSSPPSSSPPSSSPPSSSPPSSSSHPSSSHPSSSHPPNPHPNQPTPLPCPASVLLPLHTHTYHLLLYHPVSSLAHITEEERVNGDVGWDWVVVGRGEVGRRLSSVFSSSESENGEDELGKRGSGGREDIREEEVGGGGEGGYAQTMGITMNAEWPLLRGKGDCIWKGPGEVLGRGTWVVPRVGGGEGRAGGEYLGRVVGVVSKADSSRPTIPTSLPRPGETYVTPPSPTPSPFSAPGGEGTHIQYLMCVLGEVTPGSLPPPASSSSSSSVPLGIAKAPSTPTAKAPGRQVVKRTSSSVHVKPPPARPSIRRIASAQISRADDRNAVQRGKGCGVGLRTGPAGGKMGDVYRGSEDDEHEGDGVGGEYEMVQSFDDWKAAQVGEVREVREGGRAWWMRVVGVLEVEDRRGGAPPERSGVGGGVMDGKERGRMGKDGKEGRKEGEGQGEEEERPYSWTPPEDIFPNEETAPVVQRKTSPSASNLPPSNQSHSSKPAPHSSKPAPPSSKPTPNSPSSSKPTSTAPQQNKAKTSPLLPPATPSLTPRYKYRPATTPKGRKYRSEGGLGAGIGIGIGLGKPSSSSSGSPGAKDSIRSLANATDETGENDVQNGPKGRVPTVRLVSSPVVQDAMPDLKPADMTPASMSRSVSVSSLRPLSNPNSSPQLLSLAGPATTKPKSSTLPTPSRSEKKKRKSVLVKARPPSPALSTLSLSVPPSPSASPRVLEKGLTGSPRRMLTKARPGSVSGSPSGSPRLLPTSLTSSPRLLPTALSSSPKFGLKSLARTLSRSGSRSSLREVSNAGSSPSASPRAERVGLGLLPPSSFKPPVATDSMISSIHLSPSMVPREMDDHLPREGQLTSEGDGEDEEDGEWDLDSFSLVALPEIRGVPRLSTGFIEDAGVASPSPSPFRSPRRGFGLKGTGSLGKMGRLGGGGSPGKKNGKEKGGEKVKAKVGEKGKEKEREREMNWGEYVSLRRGERETEKAQSPRKGGV